jgi:hypothetical protein
MEKENNTTTAKSYHHITVGAAEMFLHILVNGKAQMKVVDTFLRKIWLECCGHFSNFEHKILKYPC